MPKEAAKHKTRTLPSLLSVLAVLGVLVPVGLYLLSRSSKELSFIEVASAPVVAGADSLAPLVQVTMDGKVVSSAWVTTLSIRNSGSLPIAVADFEKPLRVRVPADIRILAGRVAEVSPKSLTPIVSHDSVSVFIAPLLMNPDDRFNMVLYTIGGRPIFDLDARVAGIRAPRIVSTGTPMKGRRGLLIAEVLLGMAVYAYLGFFAQSPRAVVPRLDLVILAFASAIPPSVALIALDEEAHPSPGQRYAAITLVIVVIALAGVYASWRIRRGRSGVDARAHRGTNSRAPQG